MVGRMNQAEIGTVIHRLASIFQRVRHPPSRSLNGLVGELYVILSSGDAAKSLTAWRSDSGSMFDFTYGDIRLEVKSTTTRTRMHYFSYSQCNPPFGTHAVVASMHVEQTGGGVSLGSIIDGIEDRLPERPDLMLKLHETVATTLGNSAKEAFARRFDLRLAESSVRFYDLEGVPAMRGDLPTGVADVHFRSDVSLAASIPLGALLDRDAAFADLLPGPQLGGDFGY